jgi:hypothetical protein
MQNDNCPDLRQTSEHAKFLSLEGWTVERVNGINYFIKKIPLIGSILKLQRPEEIRFNDIEILSKKHKIFQSIIEPKSSLDVNQLIASGYKLSESPYLPSKTLQIDLTQNKKAIYANFQRNIKTPVKRGEVLIKNKKGFIKAYSTPDEIKVFREAWKKSVNGGRYVPTYQTLLNLRKSFPQNKSLFLASHNIYGRIIGGVIFTIVLHEVSNYIKYDSVNYLYGFASPEARSSLSHATLLYHGILWGKKIGCNIFDFEGIYDDRFPDKSWLGFTKFKKSFGGYEVLYPGCYTKLRFPFL